MKRALSNLTQQEKQNLKKKKTTLTGGESSSSQCAKSHSQSHALLPDLSGRNSNKTRSEAGKLANPNVKQNSQQIKLPEIKP